MTPLPRIMIVEDDLTTAKTLGRAMVRLGYEVVAIVDNGAEAIKTALALLPDLILMDVSLKGELDGVATVKLILAEVDIPVIFLTAYGDDDTFCRSKISNTYAFLEKPVNITHLKHCVDMAIYKRAQELIQKQMETDLHRSEHKTLALLRAIPDLILSCRNDGTIVYSQKPDSGEFSFLPDDLIGRKITDVLSKGLNAGKPTFTISIKDFNLVNYSSASRFQLKINLDILKYVLPEAGQTKISLLSGILPSVSFQMKKF